MPSARDRQPAADRGGQVLHVGQAEQRRARGHGQLVAQRGQGLPHPGRRVPVLLGVLGRGEQRGAERRVPARVVAAGRRARQHERADLPALPLDQQFRGRADQPAAGERVAVRVAGRQPAQQQPLIDRAGGRRVQVAGQHHLLQPARLDPVHRRRDRPLPLRRGQAAVVPADQLRGRPASPRAGPAGAAGGPGWAGPRARGWPVIVVSHAWPSRRPSTTWGRMRTDPSEVGSKVKLPKATGPQPGASHLVLDPRAVQQGPQPLVGGGEPVLPGGQRDPGHLAPADEPLTAADPGQRAWPGKLVNQVTRIGTGTVRTTSRSGSGEPARPEPDPTAATVRAVGPPVPRGACAGTGCAPRDHRVRDSARVVAAAAGLGGAARRLGHHIRRPMSRVSAVTRTDRTTRVSSSTPRATREADLGEDHQRAAWRAWRRCRPAPGPRR